MIRIFLVLCLLLSPDTFGLDSISLGGTVGQVGLTGQTSSSHQNAIGFGFDVGLRTNPILDLVFQSQWSSHQGTPQTLKLFSQTVGVLGHFELNDFDFSLGMGPGFYHYSQGSSSTYFGLHWDAGADLVLSSALRAGLVFRYHSLFGEQGADDFWSVMMRVGTLIELG